MKRFQYHTRRSINHDQKRHERALDSKMEKTIKLNDKEYELISEQRGGMSGVYKHGDEYLRIGDTKKIKQDLELHRKMESSGFPIAKLIEEGDLNGQYYFIEASLGEKHLGKLFAEDVLQAGAISDTNFDSFLNVVGRFAKAQLTTKSDTQDFGTFADGIHLDVLCDELPQYKDKISIVFEGVKQRLSGFPFVITHGDFNPNNLYPSGVIDLEDSFYGPFGFDLVCALVHINYFPDSQEYEYFARYRFTKQQEEKYLAFIDAISAEAGLSPLSNFKNDFEFCRAVWSLVRMQEWPKLQQFRYDLFVQKFLT